MRLTCGRQRKRALTAGETAMARRLFGAAVDYAAVRIFNGRCLPFGLHPKNCTMTPNGTIYINHSYCLRGYSVGGEHADRWFMHEW